MTRDAITIRTAVLDDLDAVAAFAAALLRLHHAWDSLRFMLPDDPEKGYRWWLAQELENTDAELVVAADASGHIVGYAYGRMEERDWVALRDECGALHDIYVDPGARRHGIAAKLLTEMLKRLAARGAPRVVLNTAWPNAAAQALFRAAGFRETMIEMTRESDG